MYDCKHKFLFCSLQLLNVCHSRQHRRSCLTHAQKPHQQPDGNETDMLSAMACVPCRVSGPSFSFSVAYCCCCCFSFLGLCCCWARLSANCGIIKRTRIGIGNTHTANIRAAIIYIPANERNSRYEYVRFVLVVVVDTINGATQCEESVARRSRIVVSARNNEPFIAHPA